MNRIQIYRGLLRRKFRFSLLEWGTDLTEFMVKLFLVSTSVWFWGGVILAWTGSYTNAYGAFLLSIISLMSGYLLHLTSEQADNHQYMEELRFMEEMKEMEQYEDDDYPEPTSWDVDAWDDPNDYSWTDQEWARFNLGRRYS
jgi:hypothetical protein